MILDGQLPTRDYFSLGKNYQMGKSYAIRGLSTQMCGTATLKRSTYHGEPLCSKRCRSECVTLHGETQMR